MKISCLKVYNGSGPQRRVNQDWHRLEKCLKFILEVLKILPGKVLVNHPETLKEYLNYTFSVGLNTVDREINQYKIVVPLFVQHVLHQ